MKQIIPTIVILILGVYTLALLFAPLYFFLTDWGHLDKYMLGYLIVYIMSAIIFNCTPIGAWLDDQLNNY